MKKRLAVISVTKISLLLFMTFLFGSLFTCCGIKAPLHLELITDKTIYTANEPITCKAMLKYTGSENSYSFYSGDPIIMLSISGGEYFNGESDLINKGTYKQTIQKNEPIEVPFTSYVGLHLDSDLNAVEFWNDFSKNQELILPSGEYELMAKVICYREQGTGRTILTDSVMIVVE